MSACVHSILHASPFVCARARESTFVRECVRACVRACVRGPPWIRDTLHSLLVSPPRGVSPPAPITSQWPSADCKLLKS